jgi:hypothetical protein
MLGNREIIRGTFRCHGIFPVHFMLDTSTLNPMLFFTVVNFNCRILAVALHRWWLTHIILDAQEAEIKRIKV